MRLIKMINKDDKFGIVAVVAVAVVIGGLAWLLYLGGLTWEQWPALKWLCIAPIVVVIAILGLPILITLLKRINKWTEISQDNQVNREARLLPYPTRSETRKGANTASIPFMITKKTRTNLKAEGYKDVEIDKMTPKMAQDLLGALRKQKEDN